jgi:hypothetical protein
MGKKKRRGLDMALAREMKHQLWQISSLDHFVHVTWWCSHNNAARSIRKPEPADTEPLSPRHSFEQNDVPCPVPILSERRRFDCCTKRGCRGL